ncbi:YbaN family protein [Salipiger sp. H15]|uniref:YbaN family protein n=1 Tax=Alloyangia sp. H15 TaxID=3029062 RepID=A0AAU8AM38_9RHOB
MTTQPPKPTEPPRAAGMRLAWLVLGGLAILAGLIGIVLPLLPTTPFVILAAFAFSRSSPRLHGYLTAHPRFGPMIADWRLHGAIAPRHKAMAVGMMTATLGLGVAFGLPGRVLLIQLICMGAAAAFVLSRPGGPRNRRGD